MVSISVRDTTVVFEVEGLDKLWALKSHLEIPIERIRGVRADPEIARGWWKGFRLPGTHIPGVITAGTFYQSGRWVFWDVKDPAGTIVVDLEDDRYDAIIVEVADPAAAVAQIEAARRAIAS